MSGRSQEDNIETHWQKIDGKSCVKTLPRINERDTGHKIKGTYGRDRKPIVLIGEYMQTFREASSYISWSSLKFSGA